MNLIKVLVVVLCACWLNNDICAQIMSAGTPFHIIQKRSLAIKSQRRIFTMPTFEIEKEKERSDSLYIEERRFRFGKGFDVDVSPDNSGEWHLLDDGTRVWEVELVSKGALSINVIFSHYKLPEGAQLYIFNQDRTYAIGAFTSKNNKPSGILPTLPVFGDHIIVQYIEPADVEFAGELRIGKVTHDYRGVYNKLRVGDYGDAASCEIDVSCYNNYIDTKRAAVKMIISGTEICSGVLLNNTAQDETPYVLSARHCFNLDTTAYSTLIIFNYETPDCRLKIEGVREQSVAGAEVVALSPREEGRNIDFALIKASVNIPQIYQPYFAGWNSEVVYPNNSYSIHHPMGDVKKVAWDNSSPVSASLSIEGFVYAPAAHFKILSWEGGVTEGGSSGGALFNQDNQVIGALSGGGSTCASPKSDYFYRLSKAWSPYSDPFRQLKHWLDPSGLDVRQMEGFYPDGVKVMKRVSNVSDDEAIGAVALAGNASEYLSGPNSYGTKAVVEQFKNIKGYLKGIYFIPFMGAYSDTSIVNVQVWTGDAKPENLMFEERLQIKHWTRGQNVSSSNYGQVGGYSILKDYVDEDYNLLCFMPFSSEIKINGNCFVGFSWNELAVPFVMMQTTERSSGDDNTAWYNTSSGWYPFTNYVSGIPSALSVELLYEEENSVSVPTLKPPKSPFKVVYSPGNLLLSSDYIIETNFKVCIFDISGKILYVSEFEKGYNQYDLFNLTSKLITSGLYIINITGKDINQVEKIILP